MTALKAGDGAAAAAGMGAPLLLHHSTRIPIHHATRAPARAIGEDRSCWVIQLSFHPVVSSKGVEPCHSERSEEIRLWPGSGDETLRCARVTIK